MTLATEWSARLSLQRQVELTNPDLPSATAVDAARLAKADADATAEFLEATAVPVDLTNAAHVAAGVSGVTAYLYAYRGLPASGPGQAAREEWRHALARLTRFLPKSSSLLTPSDPDTSGGVVRPEFDPENLGGIMPNPPGGAGRPRVVDFR